MGTDWQARLEALAVAHGVVGASLAIEHAGVVSEAATGVLNLRTGQPVTTDSVFQIGSITKVWTATLVMQLVEDGLIELDTPVIEYLPSFKVLSEEATRTVTIRQLLAHSSGIDGDLFLDTGRGDDCVERYVAAMADLGQNHPVGATMSYCNAGYVVLGRLIEVLRGATWETVLRERLFGPLGLESVGTLPEEAIMWGAAVGHLQFPGADEPAVAPVWHLFRSSGPAGAIHSTARDQLAFARSALVPATMLAPQVAVPDPFTLGSHWGLGWILMDWDGHPVHGHDGATIGQGAFLRVCPDAGLTVCLLTNGGGAPRDLYENLFGEIFSELGGVTMPRRPSPPATPVEVDATRFVGTYQRESMRSVIREDDGRLTMTMTPGGVLATVQPEMTLGLVPYRDDVLLGRVGEEGAWVPVVFFELGGQRYFHSGARASRRVLDQRPEVAGRTG